MKYETIILYGANCPWERRRELLIARPITYGFGEMIGTPFVTSWVARGDIVAYDEDWRVTDVIIHNSRVHYGQFCVDGLDEMRIARRAERLGRYMTSHLIDCSWVNRFPGVFAMSVDKRVPLERLMEISDPSPVRFRIMQRNELRLWQGWTTKG